MNRSTASISGGPFGSTGLSATTAEPVTQTPCMAERIMARAEELALDATVSSVEYGTGSKFAEAAEALGRLARIAAELQCK